MAQPANYGLSYYFSHLSRIKKVNFKNIRRSCYVLVFLFLIICSDVCIGTGKFNSAILKELVWDSEIWELD